LEDIVACSGGGVKGKHDKAYFYFWGGKHIFASMLGECPIFQKYWWWGQSKWLLLRGKK
jgi:hypothetical protein